ncbi:DUF3087 family protein [Alkalimonas sp. MEB108]|uniref:DUF3087 family protein n=1 Tax=Alkalimonas cellulosilytica TaxID=3058395 RepID=A0ABU7J7Q1_9GAMM|nr:DUF3087 family protein [Alkalimonas sp. MEB108]MEE2002563.1 DUF3087 family protein [Alkalimonas sp. MEB108]
MPPFFIWTEFKTMQLKTIHKERYRNRLNRIIIASILALAGISLGSSTLLIQLFSAPGAGNFWLNFTGVVLGCLVVGTALKRLKSHPYFFEVAYIWDLKHELNLIQRKLKAIQIAADRLEPEALTILAFSYAGSRLIWQLDDNTLVLSELNKADNALQQKIADAGLRISAEDYRRQLLEKF